MVAAREWGKDGINVSCIDPGAITDSLVEAFGGTPDDEMLLQLGFSKRVLDSFGVSEDCGPVAMFLASDESRHITGQRIAVDGGVDIHA